MMTDPIADMLTRIRNAYAARKSEVVIPYSKLKFALAELLRDEGYVGRVEKVEDVFGSIRVRLKYVDSKPAVRTLERVSKPGYRRYIKVEEITPVEQGFGIAVLSTSQGLMTNKKAKRQKVGGEIMCTVA